MHKVNINKRALEKLLASRRRGILPPGALKQLINTLDGPERSTNLLCWVGSYIERYWHRCCGEEQGEITLLGRIRWMLI